MPDVHIPKLDEHEEEEPTAAPVPGPVSTSHHRSKSFVEIGLEVGLISAGVSRRTMRCFQRSIGHLANRRPKIYANP